MYLIGNRGLNIFDILTLARNRRQDFADFIDRIA
jgi:hypothetical protein